MCECRNVVIDSKGDRETTYPGADARITKLKEDQEKEDEELYPSEPLLERNPSPELENKIRPAIEPAKADENPVMAANNYVVSFQKALSKATGLGVVSDSWVSIEGKTLPDQEMTLGDILDKFSRSYNYNWDRQGSILEFRHRKWAKMRLNQIPDEWVAAWSENTSKNGYLSLDTLAQIATLNYEQAEECIKMDKVIGKFGTYTTMLNLLDDNIVWLPSYASLSQNQREVLMGEYGLNGFMLTSEQWKLVQPMFDRIGTTRGDVRMHLISTVTEDRKTFNCRFEEINPDSGEADRAWELRLPVYVGPPSQEKGK